jgi:NADPH-dependent 2,4-dienoyl-CoA reductase/sulfur reductase-like enzyme
MTRTWLSGAVPGRRIQVRQLNHCNTVCADLVVLAAGVRPEATLARTIGLELGPRGGIVVDEHMRTFDPLIYAAGDIVEVRDTVTGEPTIVPLAGPANRQGRIVADNLADKPSVHTSTQGTAFVKIFAMTGGAPPALPRRRCAAPGAPSARYTYTRRTTPATTPAAPQCI